MIQPCEFVSLESLLTFATDSGVGIAFGCSMQDLRYAFADLLHSDRRCDFFQHPASLLGIGVGVFVEKWEISFFIEERNPACHGIRWTNRRYVI